jgi:hypothetical protein
LGPEDHATGLADVFLYSAEPDDLEVGDRVFDISLHHETMLREFDVVCWPSGSHLPCEMEVCTAKKSDIINHSPGIRVPGDERFCDK